jgi:uncharacterized protein (TIGR02594 family)
MQEILIELLKLYGLKEIPGSQDNPVIVDMFNEIGFDWVEDDETAWCSALLNFICLKSGYERSKKLDARSWLNMPITVLKPSLGDIVVLWRDSPDSWKGHVGLYISEAEDGRHIYVLGGNQSGSVNISVFPIDRVLGYRRTKKIEL